VNSWNPAFWPVLPGKPPTPSFRQMNGSGLHTFRTCGGEVTVHLPISNRVEISQASQSRCGILGRA
jgi:hypothetical protein